MVKMLNHRPLCSLVIQHFNDLFVNEINLNHFRNLLCSIYAVVWNLLMSAECGVLRVSLVLARALFEEIAPVNLCGVKM